jgi:nucleotide-binding universal stress UspA family protein
LISLDGTQDRSGASTCGPWDRGWLPAHFLFLSCTDRCRQGTGAFAREELEKASKDFLIETVSEIAASPQVPLQTLVAEGDPAETLIAASKDADLLVLGIRGRSPFKGLLVGSVSQGCAAKAPCPVVLIKPSDED